MVLDGSWWFLVIFGDFLSFLVFFGGSWWIFCGGWWFLVVFGVVLWFFVINFKKKYQKQTTISKNHQEPPRTTKNH